MIIDNNKYNKMSVIICAIHTFPSPKIVQTDNRYQNQKHHCSYSQRIIVAPYTQSCLLFPPHFLQ